MNYSGNNKVYYFEIYYSEESAGTSYKYQSFYELSDNDLESITKSTFQKLVYGLKNEDSDISNMFCSRNPWSTVEGFPDLLLYNECLPFKMKI